MRGFYSIYSFIEGKQKKEAHQQWRNMTQIYSFIE